MEGNSKRGRPTRTPANGRVRDKARPKEIPTRNLIPTQERASNDANDGPNKGKEVNSSFDNLNMGGIIDAAGKGRPSSLRSAPPISEVWSYVFAYLYKKVPGAIERHIYSK